MTLARSTRVAVALLLLPELASGQTRLVATVERVTDGSNHEVAYPTELSRRIGGASRLTEDVVRSMVLRLGDAVLTGTAQSHVKLLEGGRQAFLYSNTLVTFDSSSVWLLGHGGAYVVNRFGRLTVVVEGLARLSVNSEVYIRVSQGQLLAYVVEGLVTVEALGPGVALRAGEAARVGVNQGAARTTLDAKELAVVQREIGLARQWIPATPAPRPDPPRSPAPKAAQGGAGKALGIGALLGGGAAAGYYLLRDDSEPSPEPAPTPSPTPSPQITVTPVLINPPTPAPPTPAPPTPAPPTPPTPGPGSDPEGPDKPDAPLPDLLVVPQKPDLCYKVYYVVVGNLGKAESPRSILSAWAEQAKAGVQRFTVRPLKPGQSELVDVTSVVRTCGKSCVVTAVVDPDNQVPESNEGNNTQKGTCER
jgi:hypothetical protein